MSKQKLVVLTGAGISAESGLKTFRDADGLWEGHDIMEVATPQGWQKNPALVLDFYNQRRKQAATAQPNAAHLGLVELEQKYEVHIITQNVDDLHEKAGSLNVLHLHGMLRKVRSSQNPDLIYDYEDRPIQLGDTCELGSQLRPHVVWFGEGVPMIERAAILAHDADIFVVIGTSMVVYPAASLIHYVANHRPKYLIDPNVPDVQGISNLTVIQEKATVGVRKLIELLK